MQGLGYSPHLSLVDDPALVRRKLEKYGVTFSQVDAAYPLSGEDGPVRGVPYVTRAIAWASHAGCPCVDTTDGLHRPEGLTDSEALGLMKRTAFLVNAARGPLVDEQALVEALQAGTIGGAGLDVLETEPPRSDSPLLRMPNVILTPHTAFYSQESLLDLETRTAREVIRVLNGQRPENWINPEIAGRTRAKLP